MREVLYVLFRGQEGEKRLPFDSRQEAADMLRQPGRHRTSCCRLLEICKGGERTGEHPRVRECLDDLSRNRHDLAIALECVKSIHDVERNERFVAHHAAHLKTPTKLIEARQRLCRLLRCENDESQSPPRPKYFGIPAELAERLDAAVEVLDGGGEVTELEGTPPQRVRLPSDPCEIAFSFGPGKQLLINPTRSPNIALRKRHVRQQVARAHERVGLSE